MHVFLRQFTLYENELSFNTPLANVKVSSLLFTCQGRYLHRSEPFDNGQERLEERWTIDGVHDNGKKNTFMRRSRLGNISENLTI
jgi:hypothetical protein